MINTRAAREQALKEKIDEALRSGVPVKVMREQIYDIHSRATWKNMIRRHFKGHYLASNESLMEEQDAQRIRHYTPGECAEIFNRLGKPQIRL